MRYLVSYRKGDAGEIEATIEAETPSEASAKFLSGDCEYKVNSFVLQPDFVEVEEAEQEPEGSK